MNDEHVHGVLTHANPPEPLDWECGKCWFYAAAEHEHRSSPEFLVDAWECAGCDKPIMVEVSLAGTSLTGHTWKNDLCELSWESACLAADAVREMTDLLLRPNGATGEP